MLLLLLAAVLAVSCTRELFHTVFRPLTGRPPKRAPAPVVLPEGASVWATAVVFHDTTDWRAGENGGARLLLFKNGERADSLSGKNFLQPQQHRFREGHLWTHTTDGARSGIARDGEPYLSFEGEESPVGFLLQNGHVHTLGQRPGGGCCYRIDGRAVFTSAQGLVLGSGSDPDWEGGALCADGNGVFFTIGFAQQSADAPVWEYRLMRGGDIWKVITPPAGAQLFAVRVSGGHSYRLERRYDRNCLIEEEEIRVLQARGEQTGLELVPCDGGIAAIGNTLLGPARMGWLEQAGGRYFQYLHSGGGRLRLWVKDGVMTKLFWDVEDCVSGAESENWSVSFPRGAYRLQHGRCALFHDGILALALTAAEGDAQLIWVGGNAREMRFNGYFTGIYIE